MGKEGARVSLAPRQSIKSKHPYAPPRDIKRRTIAKSLKGGNGIASQDSCKSLTTHKVCSDAINILQWNARSLSTQEKISFLKGISQDIMAIQEFGNLNLELLRTIPYEVVSKTRGCEKGGGTALLFDDFPFQITKSIEVNQDTCLYRVILGQLKVVWMSSVYLNRGSVSQIQAFFSCIGKYNPSEEWQFILLLGDFNVDISQDSSKRRLISSLTKQFRLQIIQPCSDTRNGSCLDFAIHGSALRLRCLVLPPHS